MRSATSYFNGTLYRKTLARFWPLWGLWGLGWMFLLPLNMLNNFLQMSRRMETSRVADRVDQAVNVPQFLQPGVVLALIFAVLCAMAVFGYLYNSRSACWTHALPLRREALFTTQYLAGLSFLLLPLAAAGTLTAIVELSFLPMGRWGEALAALLTWLLAQSGICLFFFSFAAFCAMFTGHILALPAFYCIFNMLASGLWFLVDALLSEFYYGYAGISGMLTVVTYLTPFHALNDAADWWPAHQSTPAYLQSPGTIAVYAAIGVGLALASLYVYRRRHVETAGDVVAVALVRPLFKYGVSFCSGLAFGMFTAAFFGWAELPILIPCIVVWSVIGYFAAEMLLKKSFRVFKAWKGGAVMAGAMLALCLLCLLDVFGVVKRVPAPEQVEYVMVDIDMGYPYDSGRTLSGQILDPDQIRAITALHQAIVDSRDSREYNGHRADSDYASAYLTYYLSNGSQVRRRYHSVPIFSGDLEAPGTVAYAMKQFVENRQLVAQAYDFDGFLEDARLTSVWLDLYDKNGDYDRVYLDDCRQELWDAMRQDFDEGTIGVRWLFEYSDGHRANTYGTDLIFVATEDYTEAVSPAGEEDNIIYSGSASAAQRSIEVALTPNARHTLAVLDGTGVWEEGYSLIAPDQDGGSEIVY